MSEWVNLGNGLQYRKHNTRKHGVRFDRYFRGRYTVDGKTTTFGLGWESQGMSQSKCLADILMYRDNARKGIKPRTPKEKRQIEGKKQEAEKAKIEEEQRKRITFGEYFQETYYPIAKASKKPRSYQEEYSHFKNWLEPVLGDIPMVDINIFHLGKVKKNMMEAGPVERKRKKKIQDPQDQKVKTRKGRSERTIQYVFSTGRQVWNSARLSGIVDGEWPAKKKKNFLPKVKNQRMRFLSDEEGDALLEELKKRSDQLHNICLLSFDTGMRASEIFNLIWARVDQENEQIRVLDAKGRDRVVPMNQRVKELFERLSKGAADELIFKDRNGKRITEISNSFNRAVDELGLNDGITDQRDKLVFHSLRHSFASRLVRSGVDLYQVKELLGHSSLVLTERYSHLRPDTLKAAVSLLDKPMEAIDKEENHQTAVVKIKKETNR